MNVPSFWATGRSISNVSVQTHLTEQYSPALRYAAGIILDMPELKYYVADAAKTLVVNTCPVLTVVNSRANYCPSTRREHVGVILGSILSVVEVIVLFTTHIGRRSI
jgi:hypothetical protein